MRKRSFSVVYVVGAILIIASFAMLAALQIRVYIGSDNGRRIVEEIDGLLPEKYSAVPDMLAGQNMPVLEIDGVDYVAIIEIPDYGVMLPVGDKWNGNNQFDYPSRFSGSAYDHTLVIGGADNPHQFAFCDKIDNGTAVTVTDMTGAQFTYSVTKVERSGEADSQWLQSSDCDLTLFCRGAYSMEYVAVRCDFTYGDDGISADYK